MKCESPWESDIGLQIMISKAFDFDSCVVHVSLMGIL